MGSVGGALSPARASLLAPHRIRRPDGHTRRGWPPLFLLILLVASTLPPRATRAREAPPDARFGLVEAFWDPAAAAEAGAGWERILFYWSEIQPTGPEDFNTLHVLEEWLQAADADGRQVVGVLKNTPVWAADSDAPNQASVPKGLYQPPEDPANLWAGFVRRVATYYSARGVHHWVIWNEPDIPLGVYGQEWGGTVEEYYRLLKVAYLVIKQADPAAQVNLAGITFWHDREWLAQFLGVATADPEAASNSHFFDAVSLHIYFQTDTVDFIVNEARAALRSHGLSKPVWINETNAPPDADPDWPVERPLWRVDLREQASYILQSFALGLAAGAERIAVYKMIDVGLPLGGEPFGLLRPDHSRRPAWDAYRVVTEQYAGFRWGHITREPLWAMVTLSTDVGAVRVLWARTDQGLLLTLPALAAEAALIDQDGRVQHLDGGRGWYEIALPAARRVDEHAGCFIGGPTVLLVEEAPAQVLAPTAVVALSPTLTPEPTPWPATPTDAPTRTATATAPVQDSPSPTARAAAVVVSPEAAATPHTTMATRDRSTAAVATAPAAPDPVAAQRPEEGDGLPVSLLLLATGAAGGAALLMWWLRTKRGI